MKKKIYAFLILILVTVLITGCNDTNVDKNDEGVEDIVKDEVGEEEKIEVPSSIFDYFPFKKNTLFSYKGEGNEYAGKKIFFEYISDDKAQIKTMNPETNMVSILEYIDGELREIYSEEVYHIENLLDTVEKKESYEVVLKEPLKVGQTWELKEGTKRTITGYNVEIETPYDKFKALEVTTEFAKNEKQLDYYVEGIGLVASIYNDGNNEIKLLLENLDENYSLDYSAKFYYPISTDLNVAYTNIDIEFRTNDSVEELIERTFKNPPSQKVISPISQNVKINFIELDKDKKIVRVDFSKQLIKDMNTGSSFEAQTLKSIVNTFGNCYGVDKVYISIEGKPYSSGHYAIRENEYFTIDETDTIEFK